MKENVFDVLMYLFENYMYEEPETDPDRESLQSSLLQAGFSQVEINKAFEWLEIARQQRDPGFSWLITDPLLRSLHNDLRWEPLVQRVGLLNAWKALQESES